MLLPKGDAPNPRASQRLKFRCSEQRLLPCAVRPAHRRNATLSVATITECSSVLTHRERRLCVLLLLANGYSSKEIARMLDGTKRGIDNDVGWWQDRLDARSRSQVAAIAVARGILSGDDLSFDGSEAMLANFRRRHAGDAHAFERGSQLWQALHRFSS